MPRGQGVHTSHNGHSLTAKEEKFISKYIELGNIRQAVIQAGFNTNTPDQYGYKLMKKAYIAEEIDYRLSQISSDGIASAEEIMQYFTSVMRGEVKDQFGLEASLGERTKAAQELAKRQIDMAQRAQQGQDAPEIKITLNWDRQEAPQTLNGMQAQEQAKAQAKQADDQSE